jgi:hypothetical protein
VATRTDNLSILESAEPQKVGLQVETPPAPPCVTNCSPLPPTGSTVNVLAVVAVLLVTGGIVLVALGRAPSRARSPVAPG